MNIEYAKWSMKKIINWMHGVPIRLFFIWNKKLNSTILIIFVLVEAWFVAYNDSLVNLE